MTMNSMQRIWKSMVTSSKFLISFCALSQTASALHNEFSSEENYCNIMFKYDPHKPSNPPVAKQ